MPFATYVCDQIGRGLALFGSECSIMASPDEDVEEYIDSLGVISALERTCELEARLRQAIQDTHPLTTTLDWDFHSADREREALLAIRCAAPPPRGWGCW